MEDGIIRKFETVFPKEDMGRIAASKDGDLYVDVHGMTCLEAQKFVKNIIAFMRDGYSIYVIHGYNRGHAIKEMLRNTPLSAREYRVHSVGWNPGMTSIRSAEPGDGDVISLKGRARGHAKRACGSLEEARA